MATGNNTLQITDLDFNSIKSNLKEFLKNQSTFTDYDFEGSGMNVLLDLLAYNTYYNSYYMNMIANESFLDTAQLRQNILSHAKIINYVPQSRHGADAKVTINVTPSLTEDNVVSFIVMDRYTRLLGRDVDGVNYPFVTVNSNTAYKNAGSFIFPNVIIRQGEVMSHQFKMDANNTFRKFQLPSANLDSTTIVVSVYESANSTSSEVYTQYKDLTEVRANSTVYFLEENDDLKYDIVFGDNVLGKKPANGSIIQVTYLDTVGVLGNNISQFAFVEPVAGLFRDNITVVASAPSAGGADKEDIELVRRRAPLAYTAQNRCITTNDYEAILTRDYPNIEAVSVWGGEDNDPIVYGKVYMSIKTKGYYTLTQLEKENIKDELIRKRNALTIVPEIIDPDFVFLLIRGTVSYTPSRTSKTEGQLQSAIREAIYKYANEELYTFKSTFKLAKLQAYIEAADPSINASDIKIFLQNRKKLKRRLNATYTVNFNAPIRKGDYLQKIFTYPEIRVLDSNSIERDVVFEETPESFTGIREVQIINAGINYTSGATITVTGDGAGAILQPVIVRGRVVSVEVISPGANYTRAFATIVDEEGSEAVLSVKLSSNFGTLRSYYFKENGEKIIVNPNAGEIDYTLGKITLNSLFPISVISNPFYDRDVLTINVVPNQNVIDPLRNRIVAIDTNNEQAIQLTLVPKS
jgi:hypothetical protein